MVDRTRTGREPTGPEELADDPLGRYGEPKSDRRTRGGVVAAAIDLIDREGLGSFSIRKLAAELQVPPMTLYGVIENKEHLEDLVIDHILAGVRLDLPDEGWKERSAEIARRVRRAILEHPEITPLMAVRGSLGPCFLDVVDVLIGTLLDAGFDDHSAAIGAQALIAFAIGYHLQPVATPPGAPMPKPAERIDRRPLKTFLASLPADRFPNISLTHASLWPPGDEVFERGLTALIIGLEASKDAR